MAPCADERDLGKDGRAFVKIPAVLGDSRRQLRQGDAVDAADPAGEVALVGEARAGGGFGQAGALLAEQSDGAFQPQMHDIAMRRHAHGAGEDPGEVEGAASRHLRQACDLDGLVEMGEDIVLDPREHRLAQPAASPEPGLRGVTRHQIVEEAARELVPGERPVRIAGRALRGEAAREIEQRLVLAGHARDQLGLQRRFLRGDEGQLAGIDGDEEGLDAPVRLGHAVDSRRKDRQRPRRRLVAKRLAGHAAIHPHLRGHLKADEMAPQRRAEMGAAGEPQAEDRDAAFARRAAGDQGRGPAAIRLRHGCIADAQHAQGSWGTPATPSLRVGEIALQP